jgi:hypothetical protein
LFRNLSSCRLLLTLPLPLPLPPPPPPRTVVQAQRIAQEAPGNALQQPTSSFILQQEITSNAWGWGGERGCWALLGSKAKAHVP